MFYRRLTIFGAVLYFLLVFFVTLHNADMDPRGLLQARFFVPLLMGFGVFLVLLKIIREGDPSREEPHP